jgi:hypothetical protein
MKELWNNRNAIVEGIKNTIVENETIELLAAERRAICDSCSSLSTDCAPLIELCCSECGCSIKFKTRSPGTSCLLGKWLKVQP